MEKLNFTCPHCGGHELIGERPHQWIQLSVVGLDDNGGLLFDNDRPKIMCDEGGDLSVHCVNCYAQITEREIIEQNKK